MKKLLSMILIEIKDYIKEEGFIVIINLLLFIASLSLIIKSYQSSNIKMLVVGCFLGILWSLATNKNDEV